MRLAMIACEVMTREVSALVAESSNIISVRWLKQGLHDTPALLNAMLQDKLREIEAQNESLPAERKYDAILLGYGLCSNGVVGIGSDVLPLVVPRCDDCIALFLGSQKRYLELFHAYSGIYWYTPGWIDMAFTPSLDSYRRQLKEYTALYGEDNARYLVEEENSWIKNYRYAFYIKSPAYHRDSYSRYCREAAAHLGWEYQEVPGSMDYFSALLSGDWKEERFLVCPPGYRLEATYDERKLTAVPVCENSGL